jgi:hypothetical protein
MLKTDLKILKIHQDLKVLHGIKEMKDGKQQ